MASPRSSSPPAPSEAPPAVGNPRAPVSRSRVSVSRDSEVALWKQREATGEVPFDEDFYLAAYPDVAAGLAKDGPYVTAFHHYVEAGRGEGRVAESPNKVSPTARPSEGRTGASPGRALGAGNDADLTRVSGIGFAFLELTTKCNLRCVYCPVSQPTYLNIDFDRQRIDQVIDELLAQNIEVIQLNGHGESTVVKGWDVIADRLADRGIRLQLTTNLAKKLKPPEVAALSRFERINFSVDTLDPELCAAMRRGARVETILDNLTAIRDFARERRRPLELAVSCVVSEQTAPGIETLVEALLERGVRLFRFADLNEYPALDGELHARHHSHLDPESLALAAACFRRALARIREVGGVAEVDPPLRAAFVDPPAPTPTRSAVPVDVRSPAAGEKRVFFEKVPEGQTRDCLDPWRTVYVHATGAVRPCCFYEEHLGVYPEKSLEEIYNNESFRELRRSLLDGDLPPSCASCSTRSMISRPELEAKVKSALAQRAP